MRQQPAQLGVVQRQVTARPVAGLQARQDSARIDDSANDLVRGLAAFADVGAAYGKQEAAAAEDAQAAVADIGLDGYTRAMKGALDARPELFESPDELAKLDEEMRGTYFKDITDERIKGRVTSRVDTWLQSGASTYKYAKEEQNRFELAGRTLQLSVEKLEAGLKSGTTTEEQAQADLKALVGSLRTSPSFRISKENSQKLIEKLQDTFAADGTRRLLLARTFKDDDELPTELRQSLHLDEVKAMKQTEQEKQAKKFELYQEWEGLINKGRFTWDIGQKAVAQGIASADDVRASIRRQQSQQEKALKAAREALALQQADPTQLYGKQFTAWEKQARSQLSKPQYYNLMHQVGGTNPVVKAQAQRAFSTASRVVETEDQIPEAFKQFMEGDAQYLYGAGLLSQHIPPEQLEDTAVYMFMTQSLGKSPVDAYNLLVDGAFSKYSDIDRLRLADLKKEMRKDPGMFGGGGVGIDKTGPDNIIDATASLAMKLAKAGMDQDEAKETAIEQVKNAFVQTDYGPVSKARVGQVSTEGLKKRLEFTAEEKIQELKAEGYDVDKKDLRVLMLDDGRFAYSRKGFPSILGSKTYRLMTEDATQLPDGTQTVEGARQDAIINDTIKPKPKAADVVPAFPI